MDEENLLCGALVRLTAYRPEDAATIARWTEGTRYMRFQDTRAALPMSAAEVASEIGRIYDGVHSIYFGIRRLTDDVLIGTAGFFEIEWSNGVAELGIGIGEPENWSKGYGTEALALVLRFAFQELNFYRVTLTVLAYNARAIALYERAGFVHEGTYREYGLRDGERYDLLLYGLLRREWLAQAKGAQQRQRSAAPGA
ncbi:MAG: GNAT family N-acetyltransferase [Anaerolineales bacterium]|nr:GNAT family N-acetyltransferase [Anaerolineales bacterium]